MVTIVAAADGNEHGAVALVDLPEADTQLLQAGIAGNRPASETSSPSTTKQQPRPTGTPDYSDVGELIENFRDSDTDSLASATQVERISVLGANLSDPAGTRAFYAFCGNSRILEFDPPPHRTARSPRSGRKSKAASGPTPQAPTGCPMATRAKSTSLP